MVTFTNTKSTKFCQITLHIKRFIHKRKVVLFLPHGIDVAREIRKKIEALKIKLQKNWLIKHALKLNYSSFTKTQNYIY